MSSDVVRLSRREFLVRLGATSATITVVGAGVSAFLNRQAAQGIPAPQQLPIEPGADTTAPTADRAAFAAPRPFPNASDPVEPVQGTRPEFTPVENHYRIDIAAVPPVVDGATWKLPIRGLVDTPLELSLDDLKNNYEPVSQFITMQCISNPVGGDLISTQYWTGCSFRDVLADAGLQPRATHVKIYGADGFDETVPLDVVLNDPTVTLNYYWDGEPLPTRYGFPLRIHIPNHYGMKQPKWITDMEVIDHDEDGYWVRRGWSKEAIYRATSVIDTVGADMMIAVDGEEQHVVPIGGIAFAGPRGVASVEVQVDGGEWAEAVLRAPLNNDEDNYRTWRLWRYDWPYAEGRHTFVVRMTEADGTEQITGRSSTHPDGATGLHSETTTV